MEKRVMCDTIFVHLIVMGPSNRYTLKFITSTSIISLIAHPHLLVLATSELFLPRGATFRIDLASENH